MNKKQNPLLRFTLNDVEVIEKIRKYQGFFALDEYKFRHKLYRGGYSEVLCREVFDRGDAVAILPYDPITDSIVLIEQFRPGALKNEHGPWQLELIAGMFSENEQPLDVAIREAKEEANLTLLAENTMKVMKYFSSTGGMSECIHLYVACVDSTCVEGACVDSANIDGAHVGGIYGLAEEGEDILVHLISRNKALSLLEQGKIANAATIIALQWLTLNRDKFTKVSHDSSTK